MLAFFWTFQLPSFTMQESIKVVSRSLCIHLFENPDVVLDRQCVEKRG